MSTTDTIENVLILQGGGSLGAFGTYFQTAADDGRAVWLLNAGIEVAPNAMLYINSTDTSWLKVLAADGQTAHLIHVLGSLKIDSVRRC